jgi:hypothetical protein
MHAAVNESGVWRSRQALSLAAPSGLIQLAIVAAEAIETVRDVLITNPNTNDSACIDARGRLWAANAELREAMRQDLGVMGPVDPELISIRQRSKID